MEQCITFTGSRSLPILDTCPNHVSLRCAILSTNVLSWCRVLSTVSFLIRSHLVTRNSVLNHVISAATILRSSSFLTGLVYVKPRSGLQTVEWNQ